LCSVSHCSLSLLPSLPPSSSPLSSILCPWPLLRSAYWMGGGKGQGGGRSCLFFASSVPQSMICCCEPPLSSLLLCRCTLCNTLYRTQQKKMNQTRARKTIHHIKEAMERKLSI
jgi:hypothetical protein